MVYERRVTLRDFEEKKKEKPVKMDFDGLIKFLEIEFDDQLSFDELKGQIFLEGKPLSLVDELRCWFCEKYKIKTNKVALNDALTFQAKKKAFHPVKQYLERVSSTIVPISIDDLSTRYLGTSDPIYDIFLKRWLIGAVKRIYDPGCKMDYALILQGSQGIRKSTFFNILGGQWFTDSLVDINSKDSFLLLHKFWILEVGEFEKITSKKAAGEIKAFLSKTSDDYRRPYERDVEERPRQAVICGSVNKSSFLVDETGNRRFWIIPVNDAIGKINTDLLRLERDAIWSGAVHLYKQNISCELTAEEERLCFENNDQFEISDEWQSEIEHYLENRDRVSISEILTNVFEIELANQDKSTQMRVASILTRLNWFKANRMNHQGKRQVVWRCYPDNKKDDQNQKRKSLLGGGSSMPSVSLEKNNKPHDTQTHTSQKSFVISQKNGKDTELNNYQEELPFGMESRYSPPDKAFKPNEVVSYENNSYKVVDSTHTHVVLKGIAKTIPIWQVEKVKG